ncbi:MAG: hypothetical protein JWN71_1491 [Xanthobacteraceae bacterium]|jgi:hypothetical protein|nr:hypothetical protein [Xanthobacteraceae bacterium]
MADHRSLGLLGLVFGGLTFAVIMVAATLVQAHVSGRLSLDGSGPQTMVNAPMTFAASAVPEAQ